MTRSNPRSVRVGVVDQGTPKVAHYVACLQAAGAEAFILDWRVPRDAAADLGDLDGLVLCGGDDIAARHFGEEDHPSITREDERRELYEISVCRGAVARDVPLLGICRGVQILNVALGGGLEQHIPATPGRGEHADGVRHAIRLAPGSHLARWATLAGPAGSERPRPTVNSFHHQAAARPAPGFRVTAWSDDGAIEALEGPGRFCVGVQWHPEREGNDVPFGPGLFAALVAAIRAGA